MLDQTECAGIIHWNEAGDALHIEDMARFMDEIMPKNFKHNNISSFIR